MEKYGKDWFFLEEKFRGGELKLGSFVILDFCGLFEFDFVFEVGEFFFKEF